MCGIERQSFTGHLAYLGFFACVAQWCESSVSRESLLSKGNKLKSIYLLSRSQSELSEETTYSAPLCTRLAALTTGTLLLICRPRRVACRVGYSGQREEWTESSVTSMGTSQWFSLLKANAVRCVTWSYLKSNHLMRKHVNHPLQHKAPCE